MLTLEEKGSVCLVMCMQSATGSLMHQALALEEQSISIPTVLLSLQHKNTGKPYDVVCIDGTGGIRREANTFSYFRMLCYSSFIREVTRSELLW